MRGWVCGLLSYAYSTWLLERRVAKGKKACRLQPQANKRLSRSLDRNRNPSAFPFVYTSYRNRKEKGGSRRKGGTAGTKKREKRGRQAHRPRLGVYPFVPPDARRPVTAASRDESSDVGDGDGDDCEIPRKSLEGREREEGRTAVLVALEHELRLGAFRIPVDESISYCSASPRKVDSPELHATIL